MSKSYSSVDTGAKPVAGTLFKFGAVRRCTDSSGGHFHFISVGNPDDGKDVRTRRQARSHAVRQALEKKRKRQQDSMNHFYVSSSANYAKRLTSQTENIMTDVTLYCPPSVGSLDPFHTLAVDSSRLQALLRNKKARQAAEPVFSNAEELAYHSFQAVFQSGLDDPALLNAVMLTFRVAVTGGVIDQECLGYQNQAMGFIRQRMSSLDRATSAPTMGAILLLADLNSSVITGSRRVVSHTTFSELQWQRDPFPDKFFRLPPGFQVRSYLFTNEFINVLEDVYALQCIRERAGFSGGDVLSMAYINNHQASIQSRLVGLGDVSLVMECCYLAAYLCSSMLCCTVWCALVIPSHVSSQLLRKLQQASDDPIWDDNPDLLLWLLYIGGSFAPEGIVLSDYVTLLQLRQDLLGDLHRSWPELLSTLKQFIWSDDAFMPQHRIGMPSLTRLRATDDRVPTPLMKDYYGQRATVPGTLIITEGTLVSPSAAGGFANSPGIWSQEQIAAWKTITDEVHARGSFIFCQLFAMGRAADAEVAKREGIDIVAPSAIPIHCGFPIPRPMTAQEIEQIVRDFAKASENAISAGFDGVECHAANGYLLDQFMQDTSNRRDDEYGGTVENRSRLTNDVMEAMVAAVGPERVGLRLSPWSTFQGMRMQDPIPQFTHIILRARQISLTYIHLVESRISGSEDSDGADQLDFAYRLWNGPLLVAGGYTPADAQTLVDEEYPDKNIVVMFGRHFISNPDLVYRIQNGLGLSAYNRNTFYINQSPSGYSDYPFSTEYLQSRKAALSAV
ncbi:hypothetical protein BGZ63DRAFT_413433 [Mariannaea sp. PMI_226]|nr:hypothetical protein BGZ63DRAFT_413433 [Mariannaea sp. PMI_226]